MSESSDTKKKSSHGYAEKMKKIRADAKAAGLARLEALERAEEAEKLGLCAPSTVTAVPTVSAAVELLSPRPASAVPARLMSPALMERENRSPSTVPPVQVIPDVSPEESSRSERYKTLLPGQEPKMNGTSRAYIPQDTAMLDASSSDNNQHVVSLDFGSQQRDIYKTAFNNSKDMIYEFTERVWPETSTIAQKARDFIQQLHNHINHPDLDNKETYDQPPIEPSLQAAWDVTSSTKFQFLKHLLEAAKSHNLHIALLVAPGRLVAILQYFLQGIEILYNVIDGDNNVVNQHSTATVLLTTVDSGFPSLELDMIVIIDGNMSTEIVTRTQKMLSPSQNVSLLPTVSLVVPDTVEHAQRCIPPTMSEADRLHVLISTATDKRESAGWLSGGSGKGLDKKVSDIIAWILNPDESDWPFYGLPALQLLEVFTSQSASQDDNNGKRQLDAGAESPKTKKARLDESISLTINPADMHILPDQLSNSHVSESVPVSQHAVTLNELENARLRVEEHVVALETRQFEFEEQRIKLTDAMAERSQVQQTITRDHERILDLQAKNVSYRDEVLELKKQLAAMHNSLINHSIPERAELEASRAETLVALADKEKEAKRAKTLDEQCEYLRDQYQTLSNHASSLSTSNAEKDKLIAELQIKASGEQARLRTIHLDEHSKRLQEDKRKLTAVVKQRELVITRMTEENARLREVGRDRVGTRASSVPRTPRSRPGSPAPPRRHPLSNTTNKG
jgi:hypothetical protein